MYPHAYFGLRFVGLETLGIASDFEAQFIARSLLMPFVEVSRLASPSVRSRAGRGTLRLPSSRAPRGPRSAASRLLCYLSFIAALTFEHVKGATGPRVQHARDKLGLPAAF
jgi:hypothetical protein